jgi:conjugal transfer pilus assembly protein TraV
MTRQITLLALGTLLISGCAATLTGYESESKLKCGVSEGTPCTPVSKVYAMTQAGTLPSQQARALTGSAPAGPLPTETRLRTSLSAAMASAMPMRSPARMLRIWLAPWEDDSGSLHDQQYLYVTLDTGRWLIEHNQESIIDQYRPTVLRQGAPAAPTSNAQQNNTSQPKAK